MAKKPKDEEPEDETQLPENFDAEVDQEVDENIFPSHPGRDSDMKEEILPDEEVSDEEE